MRFEVYADKRGEWRWRFAASNGRIICVSSEGYRTRRGCRRSLRLVMDALGRGPPMRVVELS